MGLGMPGSTKYWPEERKPTRQAKVAPPNPDPHRYKVLDSYQCAKALAIKIHYPGCTAYEGVKVLVYRNATVRRLRAQVLGIDPHFSSSTKALSPFARFEPTARGWRAACSLADSL